MSEENNVIALNDEVKVAEESDINNEFTAEENALATIGTGTVLNIVNAVKDLPVVKEEDAKFLMEHSEHLGMVLENTFMWRTDYQKRSIINDLQYPTIHGKFHQCILEQKVQFDQAMYLAKDFENLKLDIEELECDLEELGDTKRDNIKRRKLMLDLQFKHYELNQMRIAMNYRMAEVRGWQQIEEELLTVMREAGLSEEVIWHKNAGEMANMFFLTLNNLQGIAKSTEAGEYSNLVSLACYAYQAAKQAGMLEELKSKATDTQLDSIAFVENYLNTKAKRTTVME